MTTDFNVVAEFGAERANLLADAIKTVRALDSELGPGESAPGAPASVAERLFRQLDQAVAEFDSTPEIYALEESYFAGQKMPVPVTFKELATRYSFYWLRIPIVLKPAESMPFVKFQCAIEFNPHAQAGESRPRAMMIFPDKKFKTYMEVNDSLQLSVGANADLEVAAGTPDVGAGKNKFSAQGSAQGKTAGHLDVTVGPFNYSWKKAVVDHSPVGTGKVFWQLDGAEFLAADGPNFVAVLQVPKGMGKVEIAAVLRAYPRFDLLTADIKLVWKHLSGRTQSLLGAGAPVEHDVIWDVTSSLGNARTT